MTNDTQTTEPLFDISVPDEETELGALAASLRLAQRFTLLFARCNQPEQRRRLMNALRTELPQVRIQEITLREPIPHLLDELRARIEAPAPDAVFVTGLEYSLPVAAEAQNTPFVANLNAARNSFPVYVPCPLVLWVPEYVLTAIMHGAPDFFSVRSGMYSFSADLLGINEASHHFTGDSLSSVNNLSLDEKQERIRSIELLLQDYRLLPPAQRDYDTEARLLDRSGHLYGTLGQWEKAEQHYTETLKIVTESHNRKEEATSLLNLGNVYAAQGHWSKAEEFFIRSLDINEEIGDVIARGRVLANLGSVYYSQLQFSKALEMYEQSLGLLQPFGVKVAGCQTYTNLANVYIALNRWQEAFFLYEQALSVARQAGDKQGEAIILSNLAGVYYGLGQWPKAVDYCKEALAICRQIGDIRQGARIHENLGQIYLEQGRIEEAETYLQESLSTRRKLGDLVGEGHTLHSIALLQKQRGEPKTALEFAEQAVSILQLTEDRNEYAAASHTIEELKASGQIITTP